MTYDEKLALAAELRKGTGLEGGISEVSTHSVRASKVSTYLPNGYEKSLVPLPPPDIAEDLSWMNPNRAAKGGRPKKA